MTAPYQNSDVTLHINKYNTEYTIADAEFGDYYDTVESDTIDQNSSLKSDSFFDNKKYSFKVYLKHSERLRNSNIEVDIIEPYGFTWNNGCVYSENELVSFIKSKLKYVYYMSAQHVDAQLRGTSSSNPSFVARPHQVDTGSLNTKLPIDVGIDENEFFLEELEPAFDRNQFNDLIGEIGGHHQFDYNKDQLFDYIKHDPRFNGFTNIQIMDFVNRYTDYNMLIDGMMTPQMFISKYDSNQAKLIAASAGISKQNVSDGFATNLVGSSKIQEIKNSVSLDQAISSNTNTNSLVLHGGRTISDVSTIAGIRQARNTFTQGNIDSSSVSTLIAALKTHGMSEIEAQYYTANLLAEARTTNNLSLTTLSTIQNSGVLNEVDAPTMTAIIRRRRIL